MSGSLLSFTCPCWPHSPASLAGLQIQVLLAIGSSGQLAEAEQSLLVAAEAAAWHLCGQLRKASEEGPPGPERYGVQVGEWTREHGLWAHGLATLSTVSSGLQALLALEGKGNSCWLQGLGWPAHQDRRCCEICAGPGVLQGFAHRLCNFLSHRQGKWPRGDAPLLWGGGGLLLSYHPHRSLSLLQPEVVMNARVLFPCHKATCIGSPFSGPHSGCKPLQALLVQSSSAACPQYVKGIPSCSMPLHHPGPSCGFSGVQRRARHHPGSASPGGLGPRFSVLAAQAPHALSSAKPLTCVLFHLLDPSIPGQGRGRS